MKKSVTVSIGLATFGRDADSAEKLVKIADARMYEAKRRGKNQVFTGDVSEPVPAPAPNAAIDTGKLGISAG